jgi:hypothetical protein
MATANSAQNVCHCGMTNPYLEAIDHHLHKP